MVLTNDDNLWKTEFPNVSAKVKMHDIKFHQLKLKVNDTYEKDEKIATNFELSNDEDVLYKT